MPIREYVCPNCSNEIELLEPWEAPLPPCAKCAVIMERKIYPTYIKIGWKTPYHSDPQGQYHGGRIPPRMKGHVLQTVPL